MALAAFSIGIVSIVAVISGALALVTLLGWRRMGNRKIGFISAAFATHFAKSALVAVFLATSLVGHEVVEAVEALFDLAMMVFLFIPFVLRN